MIRCPRQLFENYPIYHMLGVLSPLCSSKIIPLMTTSRSVALSAYAFPAAALLNNSLVLEYTLKLKAYILQPPLGPSMTNLPTPCNFLTHLLYQQLPACLFHFGLSTHHLSWLLCPFKTLSLLSDSPSLMKLLHVLTSHQIIKVASSLLHTMNLLFKMMKSSIHHSPWLLLHFQIYRHLNSWHLHLLSVIMWSPTCLYF